MSGNALQGLAWPTRSAKLQRIAAPKRFAQNGGDVPGFAGAARFLTAGILHSFAGGTHGKDRPQTCI
jgi:hypothetical protein